MNIGLVLEYLCPDSEWNVGSDYESLEWFSDAIPKPTESEITDAKSAAMKWHALKALRSERNARLAQGDWTQLADAPVDAKAWAKYRQELRDLPATIEDPTTTIVWPTPPA